MQTRRVLLTTAAIIPAGIIASSCSVEQVQSIAKALADALDKIQEQLKQVCGLVPAASSVLQMILEALNVFQLTAAAQITEAIINTVIAALQAACPAPSPTAGAALRSTVTVNGKQIDVKWL